MSDLTDFFGDMFEAELPQTTGRTFSGQLNSKVFKTLKRYHILLDGVNLEKYFEQFCTIEKRPPRGNDNGKPKVRDCKLYEHFSFESLCEKAGLDFNPEELFLRNLSKPAMGKNTNYDRFCEDYESANQELPTAESVHECYREYADQSLNLIKLWRKLTPTVKELASLLNALMATAIQLKSFNELDIINHPSFKEKYNFENVSEFEDELLRLRTSLSEDITCFRKYAFNYAYSTSCTKNVYSPTYVPALIKRVLLFDDLKVTKRSRELVKENPTLEAKSHPYYTTKAEGDHHSLIGLSEKELGILKQQYESMYGDAVRKLYETYKSDSELNEIFDKIRKATGYDPETVERDNGETCSEEKKFYELTYLLMEIVGYKCTSLCNSLAFLAEENPQIVLMKCFTSHSLYVDFDTVPTISFSRMMELRKEIIESDFFKSCIETVMETAKRKYQLKKAIYSGDSEKFDSLLYDKQYE